MICSGVVHVFCCVLAMFNISVIGWLRQVCNIVDDHVHHVWFICVGYGLCCVWFELAGLLIWFITRCVPD